MMKRGIYLVANLKSQEMCKNLIFSIRSSGCSLPIRLIHFGGKGVRSKYILDQVELLYFDDFPAEAKQFIGILRSVLTDCPIGFLYRYLAWFSDWDEFIYSDNDIVALCNWSELFNYLGECDLVHADEEYKTNGKFNYERPDLVKAIFGNSALKSAITAGHIVIKKDDKMIVDLTSAVEWFKQNPHIPKKHDQSLLHIASLIGNWKLMNLCKSHNWLSSWAGDYCNSLQLIQRIQISSNKISHIHYSGGAPNGEMAIQDLLFSTNDDKERLLKLFFIGLKQLSSHTYFMQRYSRIKKFLQRSFNRV